MGRMFLGIDLGTSAMKIVLIDQQKKVLAQITEEYQVLSPEEGWCEMNQEKWFMSMQKGVKRLLSKCSAKQIEGIGITGQMHTLVVLDKEGNAIRPAMMWNDLRSKELIPELKERMKDFPGGECLSKIISTGSPAANLYWLKKNEPENYGKVHKFLIAPDYLVYRLTGVYGTDYCEASTSCLYDINKRCWSEPMREFLQLDEGVYPAVRGSAQVAGILSGEAAKELGLNAGVKVLVGTGDNPATAISMGCLGSGYPVISLGTSGVLMMTVKNTGMQAKGKKILFSFDGRQFFNLVQGVVQSNGSTFEWWNSTIMGVDDFARIDGMIDMVRARQNKAIFFPHLVGDKTIYADPTLRGAFVGLSMDMKQSDMIYTVLEGLCFGFRELAEEMQMPIYEFNSIKVVGGGSKSNTWMQILANILNIRIEKLAGITGAAYGAALMAWFENEGGQSVEQIAQGVVNVERCFEPEPEMVSICENKYQKYLRMQKGLKYITEGIAT